MSMQRFIERWALSGRPAEGVDEADVCRVERHVGIALSSDDRDAMLASGIPDISITLLDAIVDQEIDLQCPMQFLSPGEVIKQTERWQEIGMPAHLLAFATDYMGNKFRLDMGELRHAMKSTATIWFFDHDGVMDDSPGTSPIAPSFASWIAAFCEIPRSAGKDDGQGNR
jgi:hypothetical protein